MQKSRVHRGESFYKALSHYLNAHQSREFARIINEKKWSAKDINLSYRIVNHWEKNGVIDSQRDDKKGWRKFSIIDVTWLLIVLKLRGFGLSLETIRKIKAYLDLSIAYSATWASEEKKQVIPGNEITSYLEYFIAVALGQKLPVYLLVWPDGVAEPIDHNQYNFNIQHVQLGHYIVLSINEILGSILPHADLEPRFEITTPVSMDEWNLLLQLRSSPCDHVTIKRKNGQIIRFEEVDHPDTISSIEKLIQEEDYQTIEIQVHKGKKSKITRTIKKGIEKI